ncbi:MAG: OmpA family protein [Sphingomonas sp.]
MNRTFLAATAIGLLAAVRRRRRSWVAAGSAARWAGGVGGTIGGAGGRIDGTLGSTVERGPDRHRQRDAARALRAERAARRDQRPCPRRHDRDQPDRADSRHAPRRAPDRRERLGQRRRRDRAGHPQYARRSRRHPPGHAPRRAHRLGRAGVSSPSGAIAAPVGIPRIALPAYPAYSSGYYYGGPGAVFVERDHVDVYVEQQYQDLEGSLRGTGATVRRQGNDLIVALPADVTFAFDKSNIQPRFYGVLNAFAEDAERLSRHRTSKSSATPMRWARTPIIWACPSAGAAASPTSSSARRTEPARLVVEAMGESQPVASNATVEGRAANRRVELIVHPRAG